jgi:hypothetical protein
MVAAAFANAGVSHGCAVVEGPVTLSSTAFRRHKRPLEERNPKAQADGAHPMRTAAQIHDHEHECVRR